MAFRMTTHLPYRFAQLPDDDLTTDAAGTEHWLWERSTIRVGRIKPLGQAVSAADIEIEKMVDYYDKFFELSWPEKWTNLVRLSHLGAHNAERS